MSLSDDDFDDEDDAFLLALPVQRPPDGGPSPLEPPQFKPNMSTNDAKDANDMEMNAGKLSDVEMQTRLYQADGEIAVLREKFKEVQMARLNEINRLKEAQKQLEMSNEEQIKALQFTVQKLEDEKKFMANEIKSLSMSSGSGSGSGSGYMGNSVGGISTPAKRRRITSGGTNTSTLGISSNASSNMIQNYSPVISQSTTLSIHNQHQHHNHIGSNDRRELQDSQDFVVQNGSPLLPSYPMGSNTVSLCTSASTPEIRPPRPVQRIVRVENDSFLLTEHILQHCINGSSHTTMDFLGRICLDRDLNRILDLRFQKKRPLSDAIVDFLMVKKNLRLDDLVSELTESLADVIHVLLGIGSNEDEEEDDDMVDYSDVTVLPVPFLLSLIHCVLGYKPAAVTEKTIKTLIKRVSDVAMQYLFLLDLVENQEVYSTIYHNVPLQAVILEKFTLICSIDIIEQLVAFSTSFGASFVNDVYQNYIPKALFRKCLPENSERFKTTAQINLVYNFVEIIANTVGENMIECNREHLNSVFNSMLKIFLIDVPIVENFMYHGLNRIVGNNHDFKKVESTVPFEETILGNVFVSIPCPIPHELAKDVIIERQQQSGQRRENGHDLVKEATRARSLSFELMSRHEIHLLNLRVRVAQFIENFLLCSDGDTKVLALRDHIKAIVRVIGLEQLAILRNPRSCNVHLRGVVIQILVRILHYVVDDSKGISSIVYPETIYEIFVYLLRIAFGSNSLSVEAGELLVQIRTKYPDLVVFNEYCERRARNLSHVEHSRDGQVLAEAEANFSNGLEFPYEEETVELAREILDSCVTHDEADNLYFNMTSG